MNLIDMHTHSKNSPDAKNSVIEMCNQAIKLGFKAIAITDHVEINQPRWFEKDEQGNIIETDYFCDIFEHSMQDIAEAKEIFKGKINLIAGSEIGEMAQDKPLAKKYTSDKRLDFIIASNHEVTGYEDFYYLDFNKEDKNHLITLYFNELLEIATDCDFDVLGHLTYFLRYFAQQGFGDFSLAPYTEKIREIFKQLVLRGKGIEINTSGIRQDFGKPFPTFEYVKMYKDLGGEILTVGSDAHFDYDVGKNISDAINLAKEAGFKDIAYFLNRKPHFYSIR